MASPSILVDPERTIDEVDPRIYSGFTEHMGRCIYGGIYDPENKHGLSDPNTGYRMDVVEALKDLKIPIVRYPGGLVSVRPRRETWLVLTMLGQELREHI